MTRYYSYETYFPGGAPDDPGGRAGVEDWFESLTEARSAMLVAMETLPNGSTGICYRRYADGDIGYTRQSFVKTDDGIRRDE